MKTKIFCDIADFKTIKYDHQYPSKLITPKAMNLEMMMHLDENKYPKISDAILLLKNWDRKSNKKWSIGDRRGEIKSLRDRIGDGIRAG